MAAALGRPCISSWAVGSLISSDAERRRATSVAAFLLPALTTWLPSGYGWGTALLIGLALWTAPAWARAPGMTRETRWLLLCFSGLLSELLYFMNTHVFSAVTHLFLMMTGGA